MEHLVEGVNPGLKSKGVDEQRGGKAIQRDGEAVRDKEGFDTSEGPHWTALPKAGRTLLSKGKRRRKEI